MSSDVHYISIMKRAASRRNKSRKDEDRRLHSFDSLLETVQAMNICILRVFTYTADSVRRVRAPRIRYTTHTEYMHSLHSISDYFGFV